MVHAESDGSWDLLRKAPGARIAPGAWEEVTGEAQARIAKQLGAFLAELHEAVPAREAAELGVEAGFWPPDVAWVETRLAGRLDTPERCRLMEALIPAAHRLHGPAPLPEVLLHDDFSHHNMGFDAPPTRALGVFDFTGVWIGDPHRDLRFAFTFEPFAELMVTTYEAARGVALDRARLRAWHAWSAATALAWGLHHGDEQWCSLRWAWFDGVRGLGCRVPPRDLALIRHSTPRAEVARGAQANFSAATGGSTE